MVIIVSYTLSINPVKDMIVEGIEGKYHPITKKELASTDSYILLGGGAENNVPKSIGERTGVPTAAALQRIVEVVKLYRVSPKPIIISGGIVIKKSERDRAESIVYRDLLLDLGVDEGDIIVEDKSKTTRENAINTSKIVFEKGFKSSALVTSALHMERAQREFERENIKIIPAPTGYLDSFEKKYMILDYIPDARNFYIIEKAIWEYIGMVAYKIKG